MLLVKIHKKNIRIIDLCFYSIKNEILSFRATSDILTLTSENQFKIIRIAKHSAYSYI